MQSRTEDAVEKDKWGNWQEQSGSYKCMANDKITFTQKFNRCSFDWIVKLRDKNDKKFKTLSTDISKQDMGIKNVALDMILVHSLEEKMSSERSLAIFRKVISIIFTFIIVHNLP